MSAVLLAVFDNHEAAEGVRTDLVRDGFPTDRVELTAGCEPGRAALARVAEIFTHAHPTQVVQHDLHNQSFEHAAARQARPWVHAFWLEPVHDVHCIYCRMFEHSPSEHSSG
jgi:hypothetical protein